MGLVGKCVYTLFVVYDRVFTNQCSNISNMIIATKFPKRKVQCEWLNNPPQINLGSVFIYLTYPFLYILTHFYLSTSLILQVVVIQLVFCIE